jgi:hypothetical protein
VRDEIIPTNHSEQLFAACASNKKHLLVVNQATHNDFDHHLDIIAPINHFLQTYLRSPARQLQQPLPTVIAQSPAAAASVASGFRAAAAASSSSGGTSPRSPSSAMPSPSPVLMHHPPSSPPPPSSLRLEKKYFVVPPAVLLAHDNRLESLRIEADNRARSFDRKTSLKGFFSGLGSKITNASRALVGKSPVQDPTDERAQARQMMEQQAAAAAAAEAQQQQQRNGRESSSASAAAASASRSDLYLHPSTANRPRGGSASAPPAALSLSPMSPQRPHSPAAASRHSGSSSSSNSQHRGLDPMHSPAASPASHRSHSRSASPAPSPVSSPAAVAVPRSHIQPPTNLHRNSQPRSSAPPPAPAGSSASSGAKGGVSRAEQQRRDLEKEMEELDDRQAQQNFLRRLAGSGNNNKAAGRAHINNFSIGSGDEVDEDEPDDL